MWSRSIALIENQWGWHGADFLSNVGAAIALFLALMLGGTAKASDHADPMWLPEDEQEANITGLFFSRMGISMF